jgi:hypothetical protein
MPKGLLSKLEQDVIEVVALAVKATSKEEWDYHNTMSEWRKGWFDGYASCYRVLTGETPYQLANKVNKMIEGSGHSIKL